jgi:hypothetical protein
MKGMPNSKIPSIFDHMVRTSSIIESNYHELLALHMGQMQAKGEVYAPIIGNLFPALSG